MFKISTKNLQEMVNKLSKCDSNKLLEITRYYQLTVNTEGLKLRATDGNNFIDVIDSTVKGDPIDIIVKADQFAKLVQRTSVDKMAFQLHENYLEVVGNGKYKVEILTDEKFPTYSIEGLPEATEVDLKVLKSVASTNKYAISNTIADGVLTGYLFRDGKCITADGIKVCMTPAKLVEQPLLFTSEMITLVGALTSEKVSIAAQDGKVLLTTDNTVIFGTEMDGLDQYPDIAPLAEIPFDSKCSLSKLSVLNILDRLTLFIDPFEKNEVLLNFTEQGLEISTNSGSYEILAYAHSDNFQPFTCSLNGLFFKELVNAVDTELFDLHYGQPTLVRLDSNGVIQLLATGEESDE